MKLTKKPVLLLTDKEYDILFHARNILGQIIEQFANAENYGEDLDCIQDSADRAYEGITHILKNIPEGLD